MNEEMVTVTRHLDLLTWLLAATKNFPRAHRNTFTRRPLDAASAFDLEERLGEANRRKDRGLAGALGAGTGGMRMYLRLAVRWGRLTGGQYQHVVQMAPEMGRAGSGYRIRSSA